MGTITEPEITTNVLLFAITMPSNCNEIYFSGFQEAFCFALFAQLVSQFFIYLFIFYSHIILAKGKFKGTFSEINLLVPFIQTSLFRDFHHYAFLCCTCITANSSFKHLSDPQLALIFTRYKERVFSTDGSLEPDSQVVYLDMQRYYLLNLMKTATLTSHKGHIKG